MATKNVTNLKGAQALTEEQLRAKLTDADALTQGHSEKIAATARAAQSMLALDAHALEDVRTLLQMIVEMASACENDVNVLAEEAGANSIDEPERAARARLWEQHHALHKTSRVY